MNINPELIRLAEWRLAELNKLANESTKEAFIPGGGGGGTASGPVDPNGPSIDPSQASAPPPTSMATGPSGAAPAPGGGGMTSDTIQQAVQQAMQQAMQGGMGGGGGMGGKMKPPKADDTVIAMDIFQCKKLLMNLYQQMGLTLPADIVDGPNRDPQTGIPMMPGQPGSTSDPAMMQQSAQQGAAPGGPQGGAIQPIQPMAGGASPAGPMPPGGDAKSGEDKSLYMGAGHSERKPTNMYDMSTMNKAAALSALYKSLGQRAHRSP